MIDSISSGTGAVGLAVATAPKGVPPQSPPAWTPEIGHDAPSPQSASTGYIELHCHSAFSLLRAAGGVPELVERAAALGMPALALTDHMTLAGSVRFQAACAARGIRAILGAELAVGDPIFGDLPTPGTLLALARDRTGYARLCQLLTDANLTNPAAPSIPFAALAQEPDGLTLLTGGRDGSLARLVLAGRIQEAGALAQRYRDRFGAERVWVELQHQRLPDSGWLMQQLVWIARAAGLRTVATNGVRHTTRADLPLYDLLTCVRLGIGVDQPHAERPRNDEAYLKSGAEMAALFGGLPWGPAALAASATIAAGCELSLLRGTCTAPHVSLPPRTSPTEHLRALAERGLATRYASAPAALAPGSPQRRQLDHELAVIAQLELAEFFLCVHDIIAAARQMGIRCSGRGSAANSLVAYCLGITGVDPLAHGLLFERFLNPERAGMPDIDIDVQSDRRDELIRYVERTYSERHAAMVANVNHYRPRSALRDAAKALGYPLPLVNLLSKVLPHHCDSEQMGAFAEELARVIARVAGDAREATRQTWFARLPLLLELAARIVGLPRHLSLHNGGLVLSREPLTALLPVRISANGVGALEVDKDDVERLGLIKFDLLGLRTLGAIEEALALITETTGKQLDIDHLPLDDARTFRLIRGGQTLAVFQIESPGQWHLLAQTQPQIFDDLIVQTALFRPGPIQGGFVRPYVARRQAQQGQPGQQRQPGQRAPAPALQRVAVQTPWHGAPADNFWTGHPVLGAILRESEGIVLFQEQILEIAHRFAGLSYAEADGFRRAMSHQRSAREMEAMRERFVAGATVRGETVGAATRVFEAISAFVGYGFCKSHAAEFARTIYQTAYLKAYYPAHYLAAFLSCQPAGFFPSHVVLEEAKLLGVPVLAVDINRSQERFSVERVGSPPGRWAIRIGLGQVAQVGAELAQAILWARRAGADWEEREDWEGAASATRPFASLHDFCARLRAQGLTWPAVSALVLVGAFDGLTPRMERRQRLWQLHELWPLVAPAKPRTAKRGSGGGRVGAGELAEGRIEQIEQISFTWEEPPEEPGALPALPALTRDERSALDYQLLGMSSLPHPLRLMRRQLRQRGIRAVAELATIPEGRIVRVAGWAISAQRPPTAHGMGFVVLEDETGRLPVALPPALAGQMYRVIRDARTIAVAGRVEHVRWYRSLLACEIERVS